jgi:tetratricopeptide (TPR) repeat protein
MVVDRPTRVPALDLRTGAALLIALFLGACSGDAAEREYMAALRGEETGMGREAQLARLEHAIALKPRRAWYRETHAIYSIDLKRYDRAAADIDTAIQLADRPYLRFLRGLVSCERGDFQSSLADFDRAIAEQPQNAQFYRGRSLARSRTGRYRDAWADAQRLLAMAPQQGETYYALGTALVGLKRWPEAVAAFDESLRRRPELIYPLRARAAARVALGDTAQASADVAEAERREREGSSFAASVDPFRY